MPAMGTRHSRGGVPRRRPMPALCGRGAVFRLSPV